MDRKELSPSEKIVTTSSGVLCAFIQHKIFSKCEDQFSQFLMKKRHHLYHQLVSDNSPCCECPETGNTTPQSTKADLQLFSKLFRVMESVCPLQKDKKVATQQCIHSFVPKDVVLNDLDINLLCYLLTEFASLSKEESNALYLVNECHDKIQVSISTNTFLPDVNLEELQNAVIMLTVPHYYKCIVEEVFHTIRTGYKMHRDMVLFSELSGRLALDNRGEPSGSEKEVMPTNLFTEIYKTKQRIKKLTMSVEFEKLDVLFSRKLPAGQYIPVKWTLSTAEAWKVDEIILNLKKHRHKWDTWTVKITDVYPGSLNIITLVPNESMYGRQKCDSTIRSFLTNVVELGQIETSKVFKMNVRAELQNMEPQKYSYLEGQITTTVKKIHNSGMAQLEREHIPFSGLVSCDGYAVDCIVDSRLENNYHGEASMCLKRHFGEMSKFQQLLVIHKKVNIFVENTKLAMHVSIRDAMHSNGSFICHFLIAHKILSDTDFLIDLLMIAIKNQNAICAKAAAWKITKLFSKTIDLTTVIDVWPGIECACQGDRRQGEMPFCSNSVVIVVETNSISPLMKQTEFNTIQIKYKKVHGQSEEARCVVKEINRIRSEEVGYAPDVKGINKSEAEKIFAEHRKLCVISPSKLRSKEFRQKQTFLRKPCIQFYCRVKGIIPIGEPHFPSCINSIETDVMEGYAEFLVDDLSMGNEVGVPGSEDGVPGSSGTVGGFVKILGDNTFLTCAHVIPGREYLTSEEKRRHINDQPIVAYRIVEENGSQKEIPCGKLRNFAFPPDDCNGSSIDAALISIDPSFTINQDVIVGIDQDGNEVSSKALGLSSPYLNHTCLDYRVIGTSQEIRTFSLGAVSKLQNKSDKINLQPITTTKFETLINAVDRLFYLNPKTDTVNDFVHFREQVVKQGQVETQNQRQCILYEQISMGNQSFLSGDSGTCVYVLNHENHARCIGMAIASHPDGGCIITPMTAILNYFKIHT